MPEPPEKYYYQPEDFGGLFDATQPQQPGRLIPDLSPESVMRILHGQHPTLNAYLDIMRRDRLLSAFPDPQDGARLLASVLPQFLRQFKHQDQLSLPSIQSEQVFNQLLFDFFTGDSDQIEAGGQETMYIFVSQPPVEQTYEYIGEKLLRLLRRQFHHDTDSGTQAFFGWIGRRLMKQIRPETDFSLDRHVERVAKEKVEIAQAFAAFRQKVTEGIKGELTEDTARIFFKELNDVAERLPSMIGGETPTLLRVGENLGMNFCGGDINDYLPYKYEKESGIRDENTFRKFVELFRKDPSTNVPSYNYLEFLRKEYSTIFGAIPADDTKARQLADAELLPLWFTMMKTILLEETEWIAKDAQDFTVSYFRFIGNKDVAAGYAFAEEHFAEIFAQLPQVLAMTEEEVKSRFMVGDPHILYDEHDYGRNDLNDMYTDVDFEDPGIPGFDEQAPVPPIKLTEKEQARTDEEWLRVIGSGPNAALYEELRAYDIFSPEDWILGVYPLFFGNWLSDREAYMLDKPEERDIFHEKRRAMAPVESERERIQELKAGQFSLPNTLEDLVHNATRQIQRLEVQCNELRDKATTFNVEAIQEACFLQERLLSLRKVRNFLCQVITPKG